MAASAPSSASSTDSQALLLESGDRRDCGAARPSAGEGSDRDGAAPTACGWRRGLQPCRGAALLGPPLLLLLAVGVLIRHHGSIQWQQLGRGKPLMADVGAIEEKSILGTVLGQITSIAEVAKTAGEIRDKNDDTLGLLGGLYNKTQHTRFRYDIDGRSLKDILSNPVGHEDLQDGNPCMSDEEPYGDLCYKKCSLITEGEKPLRTSAFSCCEEEPCHWFNSAFRFSLCGGIDIAGDAAGGGCPHTFGKCLETEEMFEGMCYMKCRFLTWGEYPFRTGPSTCCQMMSKLSCMDARIAHTSQLYSAGGRIGNELLPRFLEEPHKPLPELTELTDGDAGLSEEALITEGPMSIASYVKGMLQYQGNIRMNHTRVEEELARLKRHGESANQTKRSYAHLGKVHVLNGGMQFSREPAEEEQPMEEAGLNRTHYVASIGEKVEDADEDEDGDTEERLAEREGSAKEAAEFSEVERVDEKQYTAGGHAQLGQHLQRRRMH